MRTILGVKKNLVLTASFNGLQVHHRCGPDTGVGHQMAHSIKSQTSHTNVRDQCRLCVGTQANLAVHADVAPSSDCWHAATWLALCWNKFSKQVQPLQVLQRKTQKAIGAKLAQEVWPKKRLCKVATSFVHECNVKLKFLVFQFGSVPLLLLGHHLPLCSHQRANNQ